MQLRRGSRASENLLRTRGGGPESLQESARQSSGRAGQTTPGLPAPLQTGHLGCAHTPRGVAPSHGRVSKETGTRSPGSAPPDIPLREPTTQDRQASNVVRLDRRDPRDHTHLRTALQDCTQRHRHSRAVASSPLDPTFRAEGLETTRLVTVKP